MYEITVVGEKSNNILDYTLTLLTCGKPDFSCQKDMIHFLIHCSPRFLYFLNHPILLARPARGRGPNTAVYTCSLHYSIYQSPCFKATCSHFPPKAAKKSQPLFLGSSRLKPVQIAQLLTEVIQNQFSFASDDVGLGSLPLIFIVGPPPSHHPHHPASMANLFCAPIPAKRGYNTQQS